MSSNALIIELREDQSQRLEDALRKISLAPQLAEELLDETINFIREHFIPTVRALLEKYYKGLDVESPPPSYNEERREFNPGQWVGVFSFHSEVLDCDVILKISPKVGNQAFENMVKGAVALVSMLGFPSLEVVGLNLYGRGYISDVVSYSYLFRRNFELALHEGLPTAIRVREEIRPDALGSFNRSKTVTLLSRGIPLVVSTRRSVELNMKALSFLTSFNTELMRALIRVRNQLSGDPRLLTICNLLDSSIIYHWYVSERFRAMGTERVEFSLDDLAELRRVVWRNKWFLSLLDLYEAFISSVPPTLRLERRLLRETPIQPLPTSKIYELWVLYMLSLTLKGLIGKKPSVGAKDGGMILAFQKVVLSYNLPIKEWSVLFSEAGVTPPRPDYVLREDEKSVAIDAKYKSRIDTGDMERMLAYIADYSLPQNSKEVKGAFVTLPSKESEGILASRKDINPPLNLYRFHANPANIDESLKSIRRLCYLALGKLY